MQNSTGVLVLALYADAGRLRSACFAAALLLYVAVLSANALLLAAVGLHRGLHRPMYLLLCNLSANEIYGSTSVLPCLMVQALAERHEIPAAFCFAQIFCIHTYVAVEFGTLTVMAYDRYVCICRPLHYNSVVTGRTVRLVVLVIWAASFLEVGVLLSFTVRLRRCGAAIGSVYCAHHLVVALSCSADRSVSLVHDVVFGLVLSVAAPVAYISYSYARILSACLKASAETKTKAWDTCAPHLASLVSFVFACFYSLIAQRLDLAPYLSVSLSLYVMVVQPLQSPIIYGLKLSKVKRACRNVLTLKAFRLYVVLDSFTSVEMCFCLWR